MKRIFKVGIFAFLCVFSHFGYADFSVYNEFDQQFQAISHKARDLNPQVLKLALQAYNKAKRQGLDNKGLITIVDYSKPSTQSRLWVVDLKRNNILYRGFVSHGKNSGYSYATHFSNSIGSEMSSLGLYLTANPYQGHNGYSLRLIGLEKGFNDSALKRNIVMHPAGYVRNGGRSWGCFALEPHLAYPVIKTIQGGTLLFAYYPDQRWLRSSKYL